MGGSSQVPETQEMQEPQEPQGPQEPLETQEIQGSNATLVDEVSPTISRRGRGSAQKTSFNPPKGQKWQCIIQNGQVKSKTRSTLARQIEIHSRHLWIFSSPSSLGRKKFEFLNEEEVQVAKEVVKQMVKQIVQAKLRDRRCKLKMKHFNKSTEEK
ncbi:hypothetical protein H6P81_018999 [Aristolochia fimbriata]|uniref:Uncharacterized protein n=1 Tax=Aristolochia fimbriata TaxID=158543 RepID=A0AAV7E2J0_ARIFI|nr:hypothetical protein H6P81_018999 [Aristolochia fimbriata]